jgi:hypothetical protein
VTTPAGRLPPTATYGRDDTLARAPRFNNDLASSREAVRS